MNRLNPEALTTIKTLAARGAPNSHIVCPENEVIQLGAERVTIPLVESRGRGEPSGFHNDARGQPRYGGCFVQDTLLRAGQKHDRFEPGAPS